MGALGSLLGMMAAVAMDPPLALAAVVVGIFGRTVRRFLVLYVVVAPLVHLVISRVVWQYKLKLGLGVGYWDVVERAAAPRLLAFLVIALVIAGIAALVRRWNKAK